MSAIIRRNRLRLSATGGSVVGGNGGMSEAKISAPATISNTAAIQ
jgi:hypothetical protein